MEVERDLVVVERKNPWRARGAKIPRGRRKSGRGTRKLGDDDSVKEPGCKTLPQVRGKTQQSIVKKGDWKLTGDTTRMQLK